MKKLLIEENKIKKLFNIKDLNDLDTWKKEKNDKKYEEKINKIKNNRFDSTKNYSLISKILALNSNYEEFFKLPVNCIELIKDFHDIKKFNDLYYNFHCKYNPYDDYLQTLNENEKSDNDISKIFNIKKKQLNI